MRIAYIGLGTMGGPMVANLLEAGHELAVHDVRRELAAPHLESGARWADSPAEAAQGAELILTSLPGPREVELVVLGDRGIVHGAERDAVYADLSTSSPTLIRRIHGIFAERGVHVLDAPVSGGPPGAQQGTLAIMVGGDQEVFERVRPALRAIGDKVTYVGAIGSGAVAKLVHNMILFCTAQALAEGFTLGVKAGVAPDRLLEVVREGAFGQGMLLSHWMEQVVFRNDFDQPRFTLKLARKDVGLAAELAGELDVPLVVATLTEQLQIEGLVRGYGDKDFSSIFLVQEARAGVDVRHA